MEKVCLIGVGCLGICTALVLEEGGYDVLGVDSSQSLVAAINNRTYKSDEPSVCSMLSNSRLKVTSNLESGLAHADRFIFLLVATPTLPGSNTYDHSSLNSLFNSMLLYPELMKNKSIVICSTVMPGYHREANAILEPLGLRVSYNPEFVAQGNIIAGLRAPDMILIGESDPESGLRLEQLHQRCCTTPRPVKRMSVLAAEITKISLNCFITMKISFANMIGDACVASGVEAGPVLSAIGSDRRVGSSYFNYGYGYGGPCFPRDNRAMSAYCSQLGVNSSLLNATDDVNRQHAEFQAEQLLLADLPEYSFARVTYQEHSPVAIIEESQKLVVAELLARRGKKVIILDRPQVLAAVEQKYGSLFHLVPT